MGFAGPITTDVLDGYLRCKYLGFLRIAGQRGEISEYAASLSARRTAIRAVALERIVRQIGDQGLARGMTLTPDVRSGMPFLLDADVLREGISVHFDGLQRVPGSSALGGFHYAPVLFGAERHLHRADRALLQVLGLLLSDVQGMAPRYGLVYHGSDCRLSKVRFSADLHADKSPLADLLRLQRGDAQPILVINDHCPSCEFSRRCQEEARREDNLSALRGLGQKAMTAYARKVIFTLTQLAHTFRPRRKGKRSVGPSKKRYFALQALALRDRRVYVLGTPHIPTDDVRIYKERVQKIDSFVQHYNHTSRPFVWTATAESILTKITRLCSRISGTRRWADSEASPRFREAIRTERLHGRMNEVGITMRDAARRAFGPLGEVALPAGTVNPEDPFWKS